MGLGTPPVNYKFVFVPILRIQFAFKLLICQANLGHALRLSRTTFVKKVCMHIKFDYSKNRNPVYCLEVDTPITLNHYLIIKKMDGNSSLEPPSAQVSYKTNLLTFVLNKTVNASLQI